MWLGDTPVLTLRPDSQQRTADNGSSGVTTTTGTWTAATTISGYYGANYQSHAATASTTDKMVYIFNSSASQTATQSFSVYTRWVAQPGNATNASYTINTAGSAPVTITLDQTQYGGAWIYLGSYNLNVASQLTVTLSGQGNGIVIADAVRIVPNSTSSVQNDTYNVYTDHLNTPREIRNYANQIRWSWYAEQAEAFGANTANENPAGLGSFTYNLRFPGQLYDVSSGLSYNYFRDYNGGTGRFWESDPIGLAGGINTFGYALQNPLKYIDPNGLDVIYGPNSKGESEYQSTDPKAHFPLPSDKKSSSQSDDSARYGMCKKYDLLKKTCKFCVDFACSKAPQYCCQVDYRACVGNAVDDPETLAACNEKLATCTFRGK